MELWIRTQKQNKLIPIKDTIEISDSRIVYQRELIGIYRNEKRALEILDEIQKILQPKLINYISPTDELVELVGGRGFGKTMEMKQDIEIKELSTYVYEMPKE